METGVESRGSDLVKIKEAFGCKETDVRVYSPLTLAYIGDCIYDLIIRTVVVERGNRPAARLHKETVRYVKAAAQAAMADALQDEFKEEEQAVYRRGRNSKPHTMAKNASPVDYKKATGLEAVFGWLYLKDDMERILMLVQEGLVRTGMEL